MKKLVFSIIIALVLVISGVTTVAAYEGHVVDVRAHVENAIGVHTEDVDLGTCFPQDKVETDIPFGLSESFMADNQTVYSTVDYELAWELKPANAVEGVTPSPIYTSGNNSYYQPLNPYLAVKLMNGTGTIDTTKIHVVPTDGTAVVFCSDGELSKVMPGTATTQSMDYVHLSFSVPVFEGYYNSITDPAPANWVYGMLNKGQFNLDSETITDGKNTYSAKVPNADLGIDLKIQVTGYELHR